MDGTADAALLDAALVPECAVLELGCGAGRVTGPLVALGHPVTAVDESPEMLAALRDAVPQAEPVQADIAELLLPQRFGAVVLGSHLLNAPDAGLRLAMLRAVARHLARTGVALIQVYGPERDWAAIVGTTYRLGDVDVAVLAAEVQGATVRATVRFEVDGHVWEQPFTAEMLSERRLSAALEEAGLRFERWLDRRQGWLVAVPMHDIGR